jgi:hypothetical protein
MNMNFAQSTTKHIKQIGQAFAILIATSAALQANAWCVKNGTASSDDVTITASSQQFSSVDGPMAARTLKAGQEACSVPLKADKQTSVSVTLSIKSVNFGCPDLDKNVPCTKVCANDPTGIKLLGTADVIVKVAANAGGGGTTGQNPWKKGELIVDFVYKDGTNPSLYRFACR